MIADPRRDLFVKRLAAGTRALSLYSPGHPLVERNVTALFDECRAWLHTRRSLVVAFLENDVIVDGMPARGSAGAASGLARSLALAGIDKITFEQGLERDELRTALGIVVTLGCSFQAREPVGDLSRPPVGASEDRPQRRDRRAEEVALGLSRSAVRHVQVGSVTLDEPEPAPKGIEGAMQVYDSAMRTVESFWEATRLGASPDTASARKAVNGLAQVVADDRPSLLALTTLKRHDVYTFTHMVNVSILTMAVSRALGVDAALVREFGLAALMHDIGKTGTPVEVLNKPGALTAAEVAVIRRHVVDGAEMLWEMPEMPRLAAVVAFEHHLRLNGAGYPDRARRPQLNVCTMIVSIADVFDALRTNRPYRKGLATDRVREMLVRQKGTGFDPSLLRCFITVVGLFPVGSLVRLETGEVAVVTHEHPDDPFRPQVKVIVDAGGARLGEPCLINTWERDARGHCPHAVAEALDEHEVGLDPIALL